MILFLIILIILLAIYLHNLNKTYFILAGCKRIRTTDGKKLEEYVSTQPSKTSFGNNFDLINLSAEQLFYLPRELAAKFHRSYVSHVVLTPVLTVIDPEYTELVLENSTLITKALVYNAIHPFLKTGLLTSTNEKWHKRRKLLTPAFHFNILQRFLETFRDEADKFLDLLKYYEEKDEEFPLTKLIPKFTLNNICETAMGVNLDNIGQTDEYMKNIHIVEESAYRKFCNPMMFFFDKIYKLTKDYKMCVEASERIHEFSSNLIEKKRCLFENSLQNGKSKEGLEDDDSIYFKKDRKAMLDTLLEAETKYLINHDGICEEVDTFMFEGFDTTSAGLTFILLMLALHEETQGKCYAEIVELLSEKCDIYSLTMQDYSTLKYLDCVIKETLRLFPPVPFIARQCEKETILGNLILPKDSIINLIIYDIHRNPKYFDEPNKFNPDRFLPENSINRHPFAFVPFSAGPRNCIGQKFAMLEIKVLLVKILNNYKLIPTSKFNDIVLESGLVLRSKHPLYVKLKKR